MKNEQEVLEEEIYRRQLMNAHSYIGERKQKNFKFFKGE